MFCPPRWRTHTHSILPPLRNSSGLEEVLRFNGAFKGFTFRVRRPRFELPLLRALLALPAVQHIEPDQLFYPQAATGECARARVSVCV
jgi:hypothetical protein